MDLDGLKEQLKKLILHISDEDLNKRKKGWVAPKVNVKNAFLRKYAKLVSSASIGAVTSGD